MCRIAKEAVLASCLALAVSLVGGCRVDLGESSTPLAPAAGVGPGPAVHRVELKQGEDDLSSLGGGRGQSTSPFGQTIYDAARRRLFVAGMYSIDRDGIVTLQPEPMAGPAGAALRSLDELQEALGHCWRRSDEGVCENHVDVILAVWYGDDVTVVLHSELRRNKPNAHSFTGPDLLYISRLEPDTLNPLGTARLELPMEGELWGGKSRDAQRLLEGFVRDGTVVVEAGLGRRGRRGAHRLSHAGGRIGQVRVDPNGAMTVLDRNKWRVTATELGLPNAAAARKIFSQRRGALVASTSPNGVYVLEEDHGKGLRHFVALYDRELQLQWRRGVPSPVRDWFVDDSGWIYLAMMSPRVRITAREYGSRTFEIIAVTPQGETGWRWVHAPKPPARYWESLTVGTMVAAGDDLCFSMEGDPAAQPELVCLSPRHGEAVK